MLIVMHCYNYTEHCGNIYIILQNLINYIQKFDNGRISLVKSWKTAHLGEENFDKKKGGGGSRMGVFHWAGNPVLYWVGA
jgi:hypothetical protein